MKNLIFDFDGTIIDSFPLLAKTMHEAAVKFRLKNIEGLDINELRDFSIREIMAKLKIPFWMLPFLVRWARKKMRENIHEVPLINEMAETLIELSKDNKLYILTSNSKRNVETALKDNNLEEVVLDIKGGVNFLRKGSAMKKFLKKHNLEKSNTFYITDELRDIYSSKNTGIQNIAVKWGYNSEKALRGSNPDHIVNNPKELLNLLKN